jgi:hypothetical protein
MWEFEKVVGRCVEVVMVSPLYLVEICSKRLNRGKATPLVLSNLRKADDEIRSRNERAATVVNRFALERAEHQTPFVVATPDQEPQALVSDFNVHVVGDRECGLGIFHLRNRHAPGIKLLLTLARAESSHGPAAQSMEAE